MQGYAKIAPSSAHALHMPGHLRAGDAARSAAAGEQAAEALVEYKAALNESPNRLNGCWARVRRRSGQDSPKRRGRTTRPRRDKPIPANTAGDRS